MRAQLKTLCSWFKKHPRRNSAGAALIALVALPFLNSAAQTPRLDRDWVEHLARMPHVELAEDSFSVGPVRDWAYSKAGPSTKTYKDVQGKISTLKNVWFVVEPFPGLEQTGHTLLLFEFEGAELLGLTIEARREVDEEFSAYAGLWNSFELAYIWASAKDLLTRRAVYLYQAKCHKEK